ncbi:MAG TPA: hypothetical protein VHF05_02515 [Candidatus Paceibacterota bacterium]|jgi:hypothetical protein|nr:hypothetical protein [Candidatus Paceibacterota bacterium]
MANHRTQKNGQKSLQAEIDQILNEVGHVFDEIAEYTFEGDPLHMIDIDKVLSMEMPEVVYKVPARRHQMPVYRNAATEWNFPSRPERVIRAMPKNLQHESKAYEQKLEKEEKKRKALDVLFKKIDY